MLQIQDLANNVAAAFGLDERAGADLQNQYALFLKDAARGATTRPGAMVDALWHEHILRTRRYRDDCQALCGTFIDHEPDEASSALDFQQRDGQLYIVRALGDCGAQDGGGR